MKHEIIKTENYLLIVSDEKTKDLDWYYTKRFSGDKGCVYRNNGESAIEYKGKIDNWYKKIIYHLPINNSSILEGVTLLPLPENMEYWCKACGISQDEPFGKCNEGHKHCSCEIRIIEDDVEKLAKEIFIDSYGCEPIEIETHQRLLNCIKNTLKIANKVYSEEDIYLTMEFARGHHKMSDAEFIQSLKQPKYPKYFVQEVETVTKGNNEFDFYEEDVCKTTTNSQKQTVLVGNYIYES